MKTDRYLSNLYPILSYILKIHLLALLILGAIRGVLLLTNISNTDNASFSLIVEAFHLGLYIDNMPVSCISAIAIAGALFIACFDSLKITAIKCLNIYYIILYTIIFGISVADIPYFNYFFKHLDIGVLDWLKHDSEGYKMILAESSYYKYFALFVLVVAILVFCVIRFGKIWKDYTKRITKRDKATIIKYVAMSLFLLLICFMGVNKRYYKMNKITLWTTYLTTNSFINELTNSPIYTCWLSFIIPEYKDKEVSHIISTEDAFALLKKDFLYQDFNENTSPVSRKVTSDKEESRMNVVVVIMESMSNNFITNSPHLTPFLNKLKDQSYYFPNFYSQAIHTNQGIFASLYGLPSLFDKTIMDNRVVSRASNAGQLPLCEGLPINLLKKGYYNNFYVAHEKSYNNMDRFLFLNGYKIEDIIGKESYPQSEYVSPWGVNDGYLFRYAVQDIENKDGKPFFTTILTITNHPDYVIPKEFEYVNPDNTSDQAIFYSDYCIQQFMEEASKKDWYKNTIFVFTGDHGRMDNTRKYEMPLCLNHVPLIIYSPSFTETPKMIENFGAHSDIFPTVMGLLNMNYDNNSLGIDLLKEKRPYATFTSDDKLGCINDRFLYCYNIVSKREIMYDLQTGTEEDVSQIYPNEFDSIRNYAAATVQATNYLINNELLREKQVSE